MESLGGLGVLVLNVFAAVSFEKGIWDDFSELDREQHSRMSNAFTMRHKVWNKDGAISK